MRIYSTNSPTEAAALTSSCLNVKKEVRGNANILYIEDKERRDQRSPN